MGLVVAGGDCFCSNLFTEVDVLASSLLVLALTGLVAFDTERGTVREEVADFGRCFTSDEGDFTPLFVLNGKRSCLIAGDRLIFSLGGEVA